MLYKLHHSNTSFGLMKPLRASVSGRTVMSLGGLDEVMAARWRLLPENAAGRSRRGGVTCAAMQQRWKRTP